MGFAMLVCWFLLALPLGAQQGEQSQMSVQGAIMAGHEHHEATGYRAGWEGPVAGIAYSEFNHHLAGLLVLIVGLSELWPALATPLRTWARFLLPGALLMAGVFLCVWSDHDAWPIGSRSFVQTFLGSDSEIFQHKSYALLALLVGAIELLRRLGLIGHAAWALPLPLFAVIGGLMLFGHSHDGHPSAHKIAMDHALMGALAVTAGLSRLLSCWGRAPLFVRSSKWELLWAGLILLIGVQLLRYSE